MEDEFKQLQRELEGELDGSKEMVEREAKFHPSSVLFGEVLVEESLSVVPQLISQTEKLEDMGGYLEALIKKKSHLDRFMRGIEHKVQQGEIDQEKYVKYLESCLKGNIDILNRIPKDLLDDIKRTQR